MIEMIKEFFKENEIFFAGTGIVLFALIAILPGIGKAFDEEWK